MIDIMALVNVFLATSVVVIVSWCIIFIHDMYKALKKPDVPIIMSKEWFNTYRVLQK